METFPRPISEDQHAARATFNRPVCKQAVSSTASFHQLETKSSGNSHRCLYSGLVQCHKAVCQSTVELRTTSHSTVNRNNTVSMPEQPPRHFTPVSHVGYIRNRCQSGHLSETATDLVKSSWRDKSSRSYNSFSK